MPLYSLSLGGEEEEVVGAPVLKLTSGDSDSHPETTDQILQEKKVGLTELGGWWWKEGEAWRPESGLLPRWKVAEGHDPVLVSYFLIDLFNFSVR